MTMHTRKMMHIIQLSVNAEEEFREMRKFKRATGGRETGDRRSGRNGRSDSRSDEAKAN